MQNYLFPKEMRCPRCNALLVLEKQERISGQVSCPECDNFSSHSEIPKPIGSDHIYCFECRGDFPINKKTCPNCGSKNTHYEKKVIESEGSIFLFRSMLTGELISIIYIIGFVIITLISIATIILGFYADVMWMKILGLFVLLIPNIYWRLVCERLILFFSMHKIMSKILGELEYMNDSKE